MTSNIDLTSLEMPDKERKILEAAIEISNEKGFSSTTTSEIAKRAGVAEGTIFRYFKTKKDILHGIMLQAIRVIGDKVVFTSLEKIFRNEEQKDLPVILKDIFIDRLGMVQKFFPMFRVVISEALFHEDIRQAVTENVINRAQSHIYDFFKEMAVRGQVRDDLDPGILMRSVVGNIMIFIGQKMLFTDNFKLSESEKEIDAIISIIIDGISPQKR